MAKNKGRRQRAGNSFGRDCFSGIENCKGTLTHITRPITSMSPKGHGKGRFDKKKWSKRVRGYFKSQTKEIFI